MANLMAVKAPPIKSQGIKTKLVSFIRENINWDGRERWVEPFVGSGAVALNLKPKRALLADANPHLVRVYQDLQSGKVTPQLVAEFLYTQGQLLSKMGEAHYYTIRERFNDRPSTLDFLFLNRSCFNGLIRFNSKGRFNVPFCRKTDRFRQAYVTKITNQIAWAQSRILSGEYEFVVQDWRETLAAVKKSDFVYVDPPYEGRHTDYFSSWSDEQANSLAEAILKLPSKFAISTWLRNKYRENANVEQWYGGLPMKTLTHFYHLGAQEELRNEMTEALILSKHHATRPRKKEKRNQPEQLQLV